jgi:hypothetical protein
MLRNLSNDMCIQRKVFCALKSFVEIEVEEVKSVGHFC